MEEELKTVWQVDGVNISEILSNLKLLKNLLGEQQTLTIIREKSLKDIVMNSRVFNEFRSMTLLDIENCNRCCFQLVCGDHCMALAHRLYKNIKAHPDNYNIKSKNQDYK